jgi:hypothetical protein
MNIAIFSTIMQLSYIVTLVLQTKNKTSSPHSIFVITTVSIWILQEKPLPIDFDNLYD